MPIVLKNSTAEQLGAQWLELGIKPRLARMIQASVLRRGTWPSEGPEISAHALERIRANAVIPRLELVEKRISPTDGFAKYLFRGNGPELFEAVRIPILHRPGDLKYIVCVSSQAGCALGCTFCLTGQMGFLRDLEPWEIVDQICSIQADSPHPVRGVVFMGMGEPLLNYDSVLQAARILTEPCGLAISRKSITLSTAGITPAIEQFTRENRPYKLIVSLTSADPEKRRAWMPVEALYPLDGLMAALRERHAVTGERITLAWIMIAGVNTSEEDARQLADLTQGLPIILDLIDVNDPSGKCQPPSREELDIFRDALRRHLGMPVLRRYSGGQDILAACGLLAGERHQR